MKSQHNTVCQLVSDDDELRAVLTQSDSWFFEIYKPLAYVPLAKCATGFSLGRGAKGIAPETRNSSTQSKATSLPPQAGYFWNTLLDDYGT